MEESKEFSDSSPTIQNKKNKNQQQLPTNIPVIAESVVDEEEIIGRPNTKINSINGIPIAQRAEDNEEEDDEDYVSGISLGEQNQNSDPFINSTAEAPFFKEFLDKAKDDFKQKWDNPASVG
uniref:Uncharacterized protein n=1 Tax=Meloidogyne enterolobii TaxID=390850 RepID=A0A6V7XKF4_MELEN|nr:unnamed protein product [Meloidogyne enterolobii]